MILDDVRAGFRLHMGGSGELFGVRPDLDDLLQSDRQRLSAGRLPRARQPEACGGWKCSSPDRLHRTVPMAASLANLKELQASGGDRADARELARSYAPVCWRRRAAPESK